MTKVNPKVTATDLTNAADLAVRLTGLIGQPTVIAGALAMAAYGYRRETSDVDIVVPILILGPGGSQLTAVAHHLGLEIRAQHGFGGIDLRSGAIRIDVLTLERDIPSLIPDAVEDAVESGREIDLFGHDAYVVSLGHLIAMKLMAERKKDIADIVELIKARIEMGEWGRDSAQVLATVNEHLGWYAARTVEGLAETAKGELR